MTAHELLLRAVPALVALLGLWSLLMREVVARNFERLGAMGYDAGSLLRQWEFFLALGAMTAVAWVLALLLILT